MTNQIIDMKKFVLTSTVFLSVVFFGCDGILDNTPKGVISEEQLQNPERVEQIVIAAYASIGNDEFNMPFTTMWMWGSVRSDDAYKGGGGTGDGAGVDQLEQFYAASPLEWRINNTWTRIYFGIARVNNAIRVLEGLDVSDFPLKEERIAEMRFLRGHFYFLLKEMFKNVPYVSEQIPDDGYATISNHVFTNDELWNKIGDDFQFAADNLPSDQEDVGRPNEFTAKAYLAKVRLFQAYEQDDSHNITSINTSRLQEVVDLTGEVIASGKWDLHPDFAMNFLEDFDNGVESVFAIQNSFDDGTDNQRLDTGNGLNYNMSPEYGCCGFHQPSQNLVNAFKTDNNGLPRFNDFNDADMQDSVDFVSTYNVDPRLDHTVGIPGHPFKYETDFIYQEGFARTPDVYGFYSTMKETQSPDSPSLRQYGPFIGSAKNQDIIRYAEILLWRAEALIELGQINDALLLINDIRTRAGNSTSRLKFSNGNFVSNYVIDTYQPGVNINWDQSTARKALRWEMRLELAMEGRRFFDLVRWGEAEDVLNEYFQEESTKRAYLNQAHFTKNHHEYLPIPQEQIEFADQGVYLQNPGYN